MRPAVLVGAMALPVLTAAACEGPAGDAPEGFPVAVAANFSGAQEALARRFTERTGIAVRASVGSTGQLYAQIENGAPFQVFLAADTVRPALLEADGLTVPGSRFTYARGRLALLSTTLDSVRHGGADLLSPRVRRVALANPRTAPYGAAAMEVLEALGAAGWLAPRLVRGENVAQVHQYAVSGAADLAFVALSQVGRASPASYWVIPDSLHAPLGQDAVLIRGAGDAARAYLDFLRGPEGRALVQRFGYAPGGAEP